ncbi:GntR family transcriptional regulator [Alkalihalobacillus sp. LMS39]|uniref:GntR family transcriptional regulator n=1 Tax=Alkalihalobacillus sp. LMS39 TaxID=2924032 RepID=UPI001FB3E528|nr:GntR family transcriptional regulator [Alkalihalobacillus sp. LMS39]UOE96555.1 GntR family transcriptional regulator [Alkalihalobacillus sp. LMS39]
MIDKNSPLPIYYQLENKIREMIDSKELKPGDTLPSERDLSEKYDISRMTVRHAINNLVHEGYLYRQKGKGTFVSQKKFEQNLHGLTSFTEDMKLRGLKPGNKLLNFNTIAASEHVAKKLSISAGDLVYKIQRVRLADDNPIAIETNYISTALLPDLTTETMATILSGSLYDYAESKLNLKIENAQQIIEASVANDFEIEHLHLADGDPILLIERNSQLSDGTPFEFVKSAYRADQYKFIINIKRNK